MSAIGDRWESDDGSVVLLRGDAITLFSELNDASIDCVITDPPYCSGAVSEANRTRAAGQGLRSENLKRFGWFVGDNMGTAGLAWLLRSVACGVTRAMKPTGSLLAFCDWRMLPTLAPAIESSGIRYQGLVVWNKGVMGLGNGFRCQHELIMHFTFGEPEYHNKGTSNVITVPRVPNDEREHQTQKPVELMEALVEVVCPSGGIVLDPFYGSGSMAVAAIRMGRRFIGFERDTEHFEKSIDRVSSELKARKDTLFDPVPYRQQQREMFVET